MRAVDILRKKRDGGVLDRAEIEAFVRGVVSGAWSESQAAALLMAIFLRGCDAEETAHLTRAMADSGARLDWAHVDGPKVDKHSTGGVGDKASLLVAPLAAACGCVVPMMSGRGLAHTGGTLDKLEAIPGFRVNLSAAEVGGVLKQAGCAIFGQTQQVAPADRILYPLRDATATIESIPLIVGSIVSKKLAAGAGALVMDVKCGRGAFMKERAGARRLAEAIIAAARGNGMRAGAVITAMDAPLGRMVGNALEVSEAIAALRGDGPADLAALSLALAGRMLLLGGLAASVEEADGKVRAALASGRALERFGLMIAAQGGERRIIDDPGLLPQAPRHTLLRSPRSGFVADIDAELVGLASMRLGAGRERPGEKIDSAAGVRILAKPGEAMRAGEAFAELHYREEGRLAEAIDLLERAWRIEDAPPPETPLILEQIA